MNFTAQNASRKWAYGAFRRIEPAMVTVAAVALLLGMPAGPAMAAKASRSAPWADLFRDASPRERATPRRAAAVPLPKPRPSEAPSAERDKPDKEQQASPPNGKPDQQAAPAPQPTPQPSACRLALTDAIAIAPSIPDIKGAGGCGGEDLVRLEAIVLPDKRRVSVKPAAILRCTMASALAEWIRSDIAPLAERLGSTISDLDNFDSFECRGRNRIVGAKLSEHGRANALDVRAFKFADGTLDLADRPHRAAGIARECAAFRLHAVLDRARPGLGLVPRGPYPSRPDGTARQLPDLPVGRVGPAAAESAAIAGRAARGSAAARGRRQAGRRQIWYASLMRKSDAEPDAEKSNRREAG